jgi:hypothetical protein
LRKRKYYHQKTTTKLLRCRFQKHTHLKNGNPAGWLGKIMEETGKVDYFCVPRMQDGIALRKVGVEAPIMVMYLTHADYVPLLLHYDLEPSAYSLSWVKRATILLFPLFHK